LTTIEENELNNVKSMIKIILNLIKEFQKENIKKDQPDVYKILKQKLHQIILNYQT
jgi:hypothetical protein